MNYKFKVSHTHLSNVTSKKKMRLVEASFFSVGTDILAWTDSMHRSLASSSFSLHTCTLFLFSICILIMISTRIYWRMLLLRLCAAVSFHTCLVIVDPTHTNNVVGTASDKPASLVAAALLPVHAKNSTLARAD